MPLKNSAEYKDYSSPAAFPSLYRQKASFFRRIYSESRFMVHFTGKLRRLYLVHIRKKYVRNQIALRQGACRQCGTCCNLLITCPMLLNKGSCLVYRLSRPQSCKEFPIDWRDLKEVELYNRKCGFYFGSEAQEDTIHHRG